MSNTTKRDIFSELVEGFHALKSEREGKLALRQVKLAAHPAPVLAPQDVLAVREKLNFSRTVFARYLWTNPRTLENQEHGRAKLNAPAALPFAPSLSKSLVARGQGFDKLSPNGFGN